MAATQDTKCRIRVVASARIQTDHVVLWRLAVPNAGIHGMRTDDRSRSITSPSSPTHEIRVVVSVVCITGLLFGVFAECDERIKFQASCQ